MSLYTGCSICSRLASIVAIVVTMLPVAVAAQTTFVVTVQPKTAAHPSYGVGGNMGYAIDGVEGKELTLLRGVTYTFQMQNVNVTYPFYISTDARGAGAGRYDQGVDGINVTGNSFLTFTPDSSAPDLLWYQSASLHYPNMGWRINITGTSAAPRVSQREMRSGLSEISPNPATDRATVTLGVDRTQRVRVALYTMSGDEVALLHDDLVSSASPIELAVPTAALARGIYQCIATGESFVSTRKVIVQ